MLNQSMTLLEARGISAHYLAGEPVFTGLSLTVRSGENVAILGPSGSGKSTLLKILAGVKEPSSGEVFRADIDGHALRCGLMFQHPMLLPWLTVGENVALGGRYGAGDCDAPALLESVGLSGLGRRRAHELSGGQRQRAALARTMALCPDALLLDEPFSALDVELRASLRYLVLKSAEARSIPIVLVTHQPDEATAFGGRILSMEDLAAAPVVTPADTAALKAAS